MSRQVLSTKFEIEKAILVGQIEDLDLVDKIVEDVRFLLSHKNLNYKTNVQGQMTDFRALVHNNNFLKFLKLIDEDIKHYLNNDSYFLFDAWGNIYNGDDCCGMHDHRNVSGFSGILYCSDDGPGTNFPELNFHCPDKKGRFLLFKPYFQHYVRKWNYTQDRITVAFNSFYNSSIIDK